MSTAVFQADLARLVAEPAFRERVRDDGAGALGADLTTLERRRLLAVAADPGLDLTVTIHRGWRLGKLYRMLPFTCALLGEGRLGREAEAFWRRELPRSFYFRDEALEFCAHLGRRRLRVAYLDEVLAYERALLELRRPILRPGGVRVREVAFHHDPARIFAPLAAGRRPRAVPQRPCVMVGTARADGAVEWELSPAGRRRASAGSPPPRR